MREVDQKMSKGKVKNFEKAKINVQRKDFSNFKTYLKEQPKRLVFNFTIFQNCQPKNQKEKSRPQTLNFQNDRTKFYGNNLKRTSK